MLYVIKCLPAYAFVKARFKCASLHIPEKWWDMYGFRVSCKTMCEVSELCCCQIAAASTDDEFRNVVTNHSKWLADLGYRTCLLHLPHKDTLLRYLIRHELYNKQDTLHNISQR